jgi:hypothetical protein
MKKKANKTPIRDTLSGTDPLLPSVSLLCRLGSIVVHVEELLSDDGHYFDRIELQQCLDDPEVKEWLVEMGKLALVPLKRKLP